MGLRLPFSIALAALALFATAAAAAGEYKAGTLVIGNPWARASITSNGVVYFSVTNNGQVADRLTGASTAAAKSAELHANQMENGVMRMRPLEALEIAPGEPAVLQPGGNHIMLIGLTHPLKKGERFSMTLTFERAGQVKIDVTVETAGAMTPGGGVPGGQMPMPPGGMSHMPPGTQPAQ